MPTKAMSLRPNVATLRLVDYRANICLPIITHLGDVFAADIGNIDGCDFKRIEKLQACGGVMPLWR